MHLMYLDEVKMYKDKRVGGVNIFMPHEALIFGFYAIYKIQSLWPHKTFLCIAFKHV